jgi:hypothetical protein
MRQKFLIAAQEYAFERGDDDWFCEVYSNYRGMGFDVHDSTWMTLNYLYTAQVANTVQEQAAPAFV